MLKYCVQRIMKSSKVARLVRKENPVKPWIVGAVTMGYRELIRLRGSSASQDKAMAAVRDTATAAVFR
jgi:hypothetical protein